MGLSLGKTRLSLTHVERRLVWPFGLVTLGDVPVPVPLVR